jgi:proteasome accessory factor C
MGSGLAKLEAVAGSQAHSAQGAVLGQGGRDEIQAQVSEGLQRGKRLDITYDVATRAETTRRQVDPLRVFVLDGYGYLEAWCYLADGLRTFRLDRMSHVAPQEGQAVPPADFDLGVFAVVLGTTLLLLTALAHQSLRVRHRTPPTSAERSD